MNSEGSGHGLQIHGGLASQWFESTFCAFFGALMRLETQDKPRVRRVLLQRVGDPGRKRAVSHRVRGLVVMIVACQVMDPGSIPGERRLFYQSLFLGSSPRFVSTLVTPLHLLCFLRVHNY